MNTKYQDTAELTLRSEKIRDIMDKMPAWFVRWGITLILVLISLGIFFTWIIQYPAVVVSDIRITTQNPPLKIISKATGRLRLMEALPGGKVREGAYLAVIENPAVAADMVTLKEKLAAFKARYDENRQINPTHFPGNMSLGTLQPLYQQFLKTYHEILLLQDLNRNGAQIAFLRRQINNQQQLLQYNRELKRVREEELQLFQKKWHRDSLLFHEKVISEKDYEDAKILLLNKMDANASFNVDFVRIQSQIQELNNQISEILFTETETSVRLELALLEHYHNLLSGITEWEQTFVLKAPIGGTLEYLDYWKDNQFVKTGDELFSIIPENSTLLGHAEMPTNGAGKVVTGQKVKIHLSDFPYREFGTVHGFVREISPITKENVTLLGKENYYLISVALPDGLRTNFNKDLEFKYDMVGQAEIITKDRRLLERIFENIVYIFNQ